MVRELVGPGEFIEVFVDAPLSVCEQRDPKGLYRKARDGKLANFTGIDSPYEPPEAPDLHLPSGDLAAGEMADMVVDGLRRRGLFPW
jgi:adenylylsulfate kinase-like enzyme